LKRLLEGLPKRKRYVMEFRNPTWLNGEVIDLLKKRKVAFCIHDMLDPPCPHHITAPFAYFRFHGHGVKYGGSYTKKTLAKYAEEIASILDSGKDVYAYFNNDAFGYALKDAVALKKMVAKRLST
jgi:uncharacterized protein YecE (DUF72 family)